MKKLRMGIIGSGMALEKLHYPAYQELKDKYEIAALCDLDQQKTKDWKSILGLSNKDLYTDYREMLKRPDLDAFDIMVPIELNFTVLEEAAKAGKPIICEKPLAPTPEQAAQCRQLPQKYNIPILIAENYRYNEENNLLRDLVRTKEIGDIHYFIQNDFVDFPKEMLGSSFPATEWRQHPEFPGGIFLDYCVHNIAALQHIFGGVDKVHAFATPLKGNYEFCPYAVIQSSLKFQNGIIGQFSFFTEGQEVQRPLIGLRIFGSQGMIYLEERTCGIINVFYHNGTSRQIPYQPYRGYYNELLNFYKAAIGEEQISVTPEVEFGDAQTIFALLQSIKEEKTIAIQAARQPALV